MATKPVMNTLYPTDGVAVPGGGNNNATYNANGTLKVETSKPVAAYNADNGRDLGNAGNTLVTSVALNKSTTTLAPEATETLTVTWTPTGTTDKTGVWSTSNAAKATVSQAGLVTAVATGSAVITFTTNDKKKTASCTVTVS